MRLRWVSRLDPTFLGLVLLASFAVVDAAAGAVIFFTNEGDWAAAVAARGMAVEEFNITATNVALANEVATAPTSAGSLGTGTLTFDSSQTGFSFGFTVSTSPQQWDYNGFIDPGGFTGCCSTPDDFEISFSGSPMFGFGLSIYSNALNPSERFDVFDASNNVLATVLSTANPPILPSLDSGPEFLGFISDDAVARLTFDEYDFDGDNIGISDFRFGIVPEPTTLVLLLVGLTGLAYTRRSGCRR